MYFKIHSYQRMIRIKVLLLDYYSLNIFFLERFHLFLMLKIIGCDVDDVYHNPRWSHFLKEIKKIGPVCGRRCRTVASIKTPRETTP